MSAVILASTSRYRQHLLQRLGLPFETVAPPIDEEKLKLQWNDLEPAQLCARLAQAKAESVARIHPTAIVIGSDQLVDFAGEILGKPGTVENAIDQLEKLQGRTYHLITCTSLIQGSRSQHDQNIAKFYMRALTRDQISRYIERDQPLDCAGSCRFEQSGIVLFDKIEIEDETAIQGLPLQFVVKALRSFGVESLP